MIKFLLSRPIAVSMSYIAIILLGIVAINYIPVSLLPNVDIPEITVQLSSKNLSAREMENTLVKPIRRALMQVNHLDDIKSKTRDGQAVIHLKLNYGANIDLSYIEVNEKVDRLMGSFPKDAPRPKVIKANASDLPVFNLFVSLKENEGDPKQPDLKFVELSSFTDAVIRKRLEQLEDVAMVDMSGRLFSEIVIVPDYKKMQSLQVSESDIEQVIKTNNVDYGNLSIIDGNYQYSLRFSSRIRTKTDIENLYFKIRNSDRTLQLKDVAQVKLSPQQKKGLCMINGKDALSLSVIKKSDAQIYKMEEELKGLIAHFKHDYPNLQFDVSQDQTVLLDYSITNLQQSLFLGGGLAFLVIFFFLRDFKAPWLIGISIPTSIIISLLFFHIIGISLNIISISGLILGVGMMIDNSIIVIDNIDQYRHKGDSLFSACVKGTNEVIRPLISSVLTTCAVFIPLIFIGGIAGALFYDQAIAVAVGLLVSLFVSISLLPVYYKLLYRSEKTNRIDRFFKRISRFNYEHVYEKGLHFSFRNQFVVLLSSIIFVFLGIFLLLNMEKEHLPKVDQHEMMLGVNWNERITVQENQKRIQMVLEELKDSIKQSNSEIGEQQYLLSHNQALAASEAEIYLDMHDEESMERMRLRMKSVVSRKFPNATIHFYAPPNLFEQVFAKDEAPLIAEISISDMDEKGELKTMSKIVSDIGALGIESQTKSLDVQEHLLYTFDPARLLIYDINMNVLYQKLRTIFNENMILEIKENQEVIPVLLGKDNKQTSSLLYRTKVKNSKGEEYALSELLRQERVYSFKTIVSGKEGKHLPINFFVEEADVDFVQGEIQALVSKYPKMNVHFSGSIFSNKELVSQLIKVLLISLFLLYFILASQFESFTQPLIVLLEVPIDIGGALLMLWLFGGTINLMSLIGIVVMSGIIINDSILKIDTINRLRADGYSLLRSISVAGQRRLKPILMTSITTILALLPFLFTNGLGADLQKPLAYTIIGGMGIGTLVSLYFVPLCYYFIYRKTTSNTTLKN